MSHLCHFCKSACFVPLGGDVPETMRRACTGRGVTMLATCDEGKLFDKRLLGYNYDDMNSNNRKTIKEQEEVFRGSPGKSNIFPESDSAKEIRVLDKILEISPAIDGQKWAIFGTACLWWTSFPDDCDQSEFLPRCPFCGGPLDRKPLKEFVDTAIYDPDHYGPDGLKALIAAYHRNTKTCRHRWERYRIKIKC